jgi:hypothetical protein
MQKSTDVTKIIMGWGEVVMKRTKDRILYYTSKKKNTYHVNEEWIELEPLWGWNTLSIVTSSNFQGKF